MNFKNTIFLIGCLIWSLSACPPNCYECDAQGAICFICSQGYELSVLGTCVDQKLSPFCNLFGPSNQCFACQPTYKLNLDTQKCQKQYSACLLFDPSDEQYCEQCGFGTVLQNGKCNGVINCNKQQAPCKSCAQGFNFSGGKCRDNSGNCDKMNNDGICTVCKVGFKLVGYRCLRQNIFVYGCYIYNQQGVCTLCKSGLNIFQGNCFSPNQINQIQQGIIQMPQILSTRSGNFKIITQQTIVTTTTTFNNQNNFDTFNDDAGFTFSNINSGGSTNNNGQLTTMTTVTTTNNAGASTRTNSGSSTSNNGGSTTNNNSGSRTNSGTSSTTVINSGSSTSNNNVVSTTGSSSGSQIIASVPNCQSYNLLNGVCIVCMPTFTLNNGNCIQTVTPNTANCQSYNLLNGICVECIPNYTLTNGQCIWNQPNNSGSSSSGSSINIINISGISSNSARDPNCAKYQNNICSLCSNRYFIGSGGLCAPVNPLCKDFQRNGACKSCYPGYSISGTQCIVSRQTDPFCKQFNGGICSVCFQGYFYSRSKNSCQPLNPLCKTSNIADGSCKSCYPGYRLVSQTGLCSVAFQDPNCKKTDPQSNRCLQCSTNFYLNQSSGRCIQFNPLCKTSDPNNGRCLSCFPGYVLTSGSVCTVAQQTVTDINCQNFTNNICVKCYNSYFLNAKKVCILANPLCKTSNQADGSCLTCYPGYSVNRGNCTLSAVTGGDPNCKKDDGKGLCIQCYLGYYVDKGKCLKNQLICKALTSRGDGCTQCYSGYVLVRNICVLQKQAPNQNNDPGCIKSEGTVCINCAAGFYLSVNGVCIQQNPLCRSIDRTNGACTSCYPGFIISGMTCTVAAPFQIPNCVQVLGDRCLLCNNGYYVKNNVCEAVSILCSKYDLKDGLCTECIPGYFYQDRECVYPSMGPDPNCIRYTNSFCSTCNQRSVLLQYRCQTIDPDCNQFDSQQSICLSCLKNKKPSGIKCI